jgi:predicted nuclease of predicted toxin-antitoxin system
MRFLLDIGVAPRTATFLRAAGHDAIHLSEQNLFTLPDDQIMLKADAESRVLVSFDLDFPRLIALARRRLPSLVLFRIHRLDADGVHEHLLRIIDQFRIPLEAGAIVTVDETRIRCRPLPIS